LAPVLFNALVSTIVETLRGILHNRSGAANAPAVVAAVFTLMLIIGFYARLAGLYLTRPPRSPATDHWHGEKVHGK